MVYHINGGGNDPAGFDCSGFICYVWQNFGVILPRTADEQFKIGLPVEWQDLETGDLVYFSTYASGPSHVGIYIGNGKFIHASSGAGKVTITPLLKPYYAQRYIGARRLIF